MTLSKEIKIDKIEVSGDYKHLCIRTVTQIKEDDSVISSKNHRHTLTCGDLDESGNFIETDLSNEDPAIVEIANLVWTDSVKSSWYQKMYDSWLKNNPNAVGIASTSSGIGTV